MESVVGKKTLLFLFSCFRCICGPLMYKYLQMYSSYFCMGVTIKCCLPTYLELLWTEQCVQCEGLSGVGCQLHELWGTKHLLCVWGFHPVTQGAVCVCVVCALVSPGDRLWGELCYTAQKNTFPPERTGPSTARKWMENMFTAKLPHAYILFVSFPEQEFV